METLTKITIKLCEMSPPILTFYEEEGLCQNPNEICSYCEKSNFHERESYFCGKKASILNQELEFA
jgi:hypothetical protein